MSIARYLSNLVPFLSSTGVVGVAGGGTGLTSPGTSGNVLTSNGTSWVSSPGGGGGTGLTTIGDPGCLISGTQDPGVNNYLMRLIVAPSNFTISKIAFLVGIATPSSVYQPFVYSNNFSPYSPNTLLGSGPQVTGATQGYNEAVLTTPVSVVKGQMFWVGASIITSPLSSLYTFGGATSGFASNGGSSVPASTSPGITLNSSYGFWAVA